MKSSTDKTKRTIAGIILIGLILLQTNFHPAAAQQASPTLEAAIYMALERVSTQPENSTAVWTILEIRQNDAWGVAKAELAEGENFLAFEIVIAYRDSAGIWQAVSQKDSGWKDAVTRAPDDVMSAPFHEMLLSEMNSAKTLSAEEMKFGFPFCGTAGVSRGYHYINGKLDKYAIDFANLPNHRINAAQTGTILLITKDSGTQCKKMNDDQWNCFGVKEPANQVKISHANGYYTYYLHLQKDSIPKNIIDEYKEKGVVTVTKGTFIGIEGNTGITYPYGSGGTHLHFAVWQNTTGGKGVEFYFREGGKDIHSSTIKYNQNHSSTNCGDNQPPETVFTGSSPHVWSTGANPTLLQWSGSDNVTPVDQLKFSYRLNEGAWSELSTSKSVQFSGLADGEYTFQVKAFDQGYLDDPTPATVTFGIDRSNPTQPEIIIASPGCANNLNGEPQNTCRDPAFTWSASDSLSGMRGYYYSWGTESDAVPTTYTTGQTFDPPAISPEDGHASYFLSVKAVDFLGHESSISTFAVLYDKDRPNAVFTINRGSEETYQVNVTLHATSNDPGSGISRVRVSNNQVYWSEWLEYQDEIPWTIPGQDNRVYTVYMQVSDRAGNVSDVMSDSIRLNLNPPAPHSLTYRMCQNSLTSAGSFNTTASTGYRLDTVFGQPTGYSQNPPGSASYQLRNGFWAIYPGCLPIEWTSTVMGYTIPWYSLNAGGNNRATPLYQLTDTLGQPFASANGLLLSTSYQLSSGFWSNPGSSSGGSGSPSLDPLLSDPRMAANPDTPPVTTSEFDEFKILINENSRYTNTPNVTLSLDAPFGARMILWSGDPLAEGSTPVIPEGVMDDWIQYQPSIEWSIVLSDTYVKPRAVYFLVEMVDGLVLGPFSDEIIYDPVAPTAQITPFGTDDQYITVEMIAMDDNSGVSDVRISASPRFDGAEWQPYEQSYFEWNSSDGNAYIQFRDRAGNVSQTYTVDFGGTLSQTYLPIIRK